MTASQPTRALSTLWVVAACGLAVGLGLVGMCGAGCAPIVACPAGTYPAKVDTDQAASGSAGATLATEGAEAKGSASRSTDWSCKRLCRKGEIWNGSRCETLPKDP